MCKGKFPHEREDIDPTAILRFDRNSYSWNSINSLCFLCFLKAQQRVLQNLTAWSGSLILVLLGNLLGAHIAGSLLGGLWFRIYRHNWLRDTRTPCEHARALQWLHGRAKNGENRIDRLFVMTFGEEMPFWGNSI